MTALLQRDGASAGEPETTDVAPILSVALDVWGANCRLTLRGELGASLAALEAQVDQLGCLPRAHVVVDMRQVTALDEVGANVILGLYYYVLGHGGGLEVTAPTGAVAETLRLVGGGLLSPTEDVAG